MTEEEVAEGALRQFVATGDRCHLDNATPDELRVMVRVAVADLRTFSMEPFLLRAADRLLAACEDAVRRGRVDARSPIGDATLDFREMRREGRERLAADGDPEVVRVDANVRCPDCDRWYREHPYDEKNLSDGEPYLRVGCDGRRLKL